MTGALAEWSEFNVAMAGASAALAGLVIVAASVNIDKIIRARTLTARLGAAIASLVLALTASAVALMPGIDLTWYGIILLVSTLMAGVSQPTRRAASSSDPRSGAGRTQSRNRCSGSCRSSRTSRRGSR